jgi:cytochrome c
VIGGKAALAAGALLGLSVGLSFVHPWGNVRDSARDGETLGGANVPANVRAILETKCANCHSNQTRWPSYGRLAPASWLMEHDVYAARSAMNLSRWNEMSADDQAASLTRMAAEARSGEMPPRPYALMHPASRLSAEEKQALIVWARAERARIRMMDAQPKGAEHP